MTTHENNVSVASNGMNLQRFQNYFFVLPAVLSVAAVLSVIVFGLRPGIDLAGGSLLQVTYPDGRPDVARVHETVDTLEYGEIRIQPSGTNDFILRQRVLTGDEKNTLDAELAALGSVEEVQYTSVGPSIGGELITKAWWAVALVAISIIIFIAWAFRHVSKPVASWKYGVVAIVTLLHDILLPLGLFAFLGYFYGSEVGSLFIVALLTILGISINDTIVVFDRIRENLARNEKQNKTQSFTDVVWKSITQTITRSINTSVTVIIMLLALVFLGPESTRDFALTLTVGMVAGTYSSIFLASPLLLLIAKYQKTEKIVR